MPLNDLVAAIWDLEELHRDLINHLHDLIDSLEISARPQEH